MKTKRTLYTVQMAVAVILSCLSPRNVSAQSGADQIAQADASFQLVLYNQVGTESRFSSRNGVVEPISVRLNERIPFTIEVPREKAGYPVMIGDLDGGQVSAVIDEQDVPLFGNTAPPTLSVSERGLVDLSFQAGATRGLYRILVRIGIDQYQLQIYVVNPNQTARPHP